MATPLGRAFYARDARVVARALLGKRLVRREGELLLSGIIIETEAYLGLEDTASHASRGMTPRNAVMFGPAGHAYVYFVYGMHSMLNVVTGADGVAAAVLIRAVAPGEGIETMRERRRGARRIADGPGKLCQALGITRALNGADLTVGGEGAELWIEPGRRIAKDRIQTSPRIGIDYAHAEHREAHWRYFVAAAAS